MRPLNPRAQGMDKRLRYQRAEKRLLASLCGSVNLNQTRLEHATAKLKMGAYVEERTVAAALARRCHKRETEHFCMEPFRSQPGAVKNWRLLWQSYPPRTRKELLLAQFREKGDGKLVVLGHQVCTEASVCSNIHHQLLNGLVFK